MICEIRFDSIGLIRQNFHSVGAKRVISVVRINKKLAETNSASKRLGGQIGHYCLAFVSGDTCFESCPKSHT